MEVKTMAMTSVEWKQLIDDIISKSGDQGALTMLLTKVSDEYASVLAENETVRQRSDELTEENKQLKEYNWDLYKRVDDQRAARKQSQQAGGAADRASTIKVEDLFKE